MISINDIFYCPVCYNKLERLDGCGAVGYMCHTCKRLVSRKNMLTIEDINSIKNNKKEKPPEL